VSAGGTDHCPQLPSVSWDLHLSLPWDSPPGPSAGRRRRRKKDDDSNKDMDILEELVWHGAVRCFPCRTGWGGGRDLSEQWGLEMKGASGDGRLTLASGPGAVGMRCSAMCGGGAGLAPVLCPECNWGLAGTCVSELENGISMTLWFERSSLEWREGGCGLRIG